jgi:hypothetical protein
MTKKEKEGICVLAVIFALTIAGLESIKLVGIIAMNWK